MSQKYNIYVLSRYLDLEIFRFVVELVLLE